MTRGRRPTGRYVAHQYNHSADASPQARQARRFAEHGGASQALATLGWLGGCWCGNPQPYHDWKGKADGKPHPR